MTVTRRTVPDVALPVGTRVELHPASDAWMRGDRYGTVQAVTVKHSGIPARRVLLDRSQTCRVYAVESLTEVCAECDGIVGEDGVCR